MEYTRAKFYQETSTISVIDSADKSDDENNSNDDLDVTAISNISNELDTTINTTSTSSVIKKSTSTVSLRKEKWDLPDVPPTFLPPYWLAFVIFGRFSRDRWNEPICTLLDIIAVGKGKNRKDTLTEVKGDDDKNRLNSVGRGQSSAATRLEAIENEKLDLETRNVELGEFAVLSGQHLEEIKDLRLQIQEATDLNETDLVVSLRSDLANAYTRKRELTETFNRNINQRQDDKTKKQIANP